MRSAQAGQGLVVAAFPDAARAGAAMLRNGGNAVDAACAAAWALGVCEPAESGLGGQTTMLIRLADGHSVVVDGHSRAPSSLTRAACGRRSQKRGFKACTVPSTVATLAEAQRRYGRLSLRETLEPSILLALDGYRITKLQRRLQKWTARRLTESPHTAALFLAPGGVPYKVNDIFRQPTLARTLTTLAERGPDEFYHGEIARDLCDEMRQHGGFITQKDLAELGLPVLRAPLETEYRGRRILSIPPPGGGVQVLLSLQVLAQLGANWHDKASWRASVLEATLAAFIERERWPDHPADMTPSLARWMVSAERAERIAATLRDAKPPPPVRDSIGESGNTTHLCAADAEGNVVSLTQSIQSVFGAKVASASCGFVYNNYLSTCPRDPHPYRLGPGALPQSNAAPTIVMSADGSGPEIVLGSAGSRRIVSSVTSVISSMLDLGMSLADAVAAPRAHALMNRKIWAEPGSIDPFVRERLAGRFRTIRELAAGSYKLGAVQAIHRTADGVMTGVADPRRDGASAIQ